MNIKGNSLGASVLAGVVIGLVLTAQQCSAVQVDTVRGPVLKFQDGADTVVYIPSNATIHVSGEGKFDMLVVGGGGGGGLGGGGGGGGAVVYTQDLEVVEGDYDIVVGQGGAGGYLDAKKWMASGNGGESSAFDITAPGGGGGGSYGANGSIGLDGASGGGAACGYFTGSNPRTLSGGSGIENYGFSGGASTNLANTSSSLIAGGGGGAGGPGGDGHYETVTYHRDGNPTDTRLFGACGGDGKLCAIWGKRYYGGGGGGMRSDGYTYGEVRVCRGGRGGGGAGGWRKSGTSYPGEAGVAGTGGGGGGSGGPGNADGYSSQCSAGSPGGSGVVILRYRTPAGESPKLLDRELEVTGGMQTRPNRKDFVHTFTEDGTLVLPQALTVDLLMVGGGGGGAKFHGGGGGGGGVVVYSNLVLSAGSYAITIGAGGAGGAVDSGSRGGDTSLRFAGDGIAYELVAHGGGAGGGVAIGGDGANGGGGGVGNVYASAVEHGKNSFRMGGWSLFDAGYDGGSSTNGVGEFTQVGGGGAGAGGSGGNGAVKPTETGGTSYTYGDGGIGLPCDFSGTLAYYGGGGGGGASGSANVYVGGAAGLGGGGAGGNYGPSTGGRQPTVGANGTPNTGGGGGGGGSNNETGAAGGTGGSGIVIVRYRQIPNGMLLLFR